MIGILVLAKNQKPALNVVVLIGTRQEKTKKKKTNNKQFTGRKANISLKKEKSLKMKGKHD